MNYREPNKCRGCLFIGSFEDSGASTPLCTRNRGRLAEAIKAYNAEQECPWHITKTDIIRMQDQAALISVAETASTATEAFKTLKKND